MPSLSRLLQCWIQVSVWPDYLSGKNSINLCPDTLIVLTLHLAIVFGPWSLVPLWYGNLPLNGNTKRTSMQLLTADSD